MTYNFNTMKGIDILSKDTLDAIKADAICVTTNGIVKSNGELIMGAGVAKQFKETIPNIERILGAKVRITGNHVYEACKYKTNLKEVQVLSFPTKNDFRDKADINLIIQSAKRLVKWADKTGATRILIPSPGTGLGGLTYKTVYSALNDILDKRFTIVTK